MTRAADYRARRAAGACTDCGNPSEAGRCRGCLDALAENRTSRGRASIGSRNDALGPERTLESIGARLGISRERVRQHIENGVVHLLDSLRALPGNADITRHDVLLALCRLAILSGETQPTVTDSDRSKRGGKSSGYWRGRLAKESA